MLRLTLSAILIGVVAALPAVAGESEARVVGDYCRAEIAPTGQVCDCLLRQLAKLTEEQQALVASIVEEDATAVAAARAELTAAELEQAESFLTRETLLCRPSG
jgi:hypothetical protein